jgi:hypothetical protein
MRIVECRVCPAQFPVRIIAQVEPPLPIEPHCLGMAVLKIEDLGLGSRSGHDEQQSEKHFCEIRCGPEKHRLEMVAHQHKPRN